MAEDSSTSVSEQYSGYGKSSLGTGTSRKSSGAAKFWISIAVILSLGSISATGYLAYRLEFQFLPQFGEESQRIQSTGEEVSTLMDGIQRMETQTDDHIQKLAGMIEEYQSSLERLEKTIDDSNIEFANEVADVKESISALYQEQGQAADNWQLQEIMYLLLMGKYRVHFAGDVESTLLLWQVAEKQLQANPDPRLIDVKQAVREEIAALESVHNVDVAGITGTILRLVEDVESLPLNLTGVAPAPASDDREPAPDQAETQESSAVDNVLSEVWTDIQSLVRVRRIDVSEQSLLMPQMKINVVESIRLALFAAQAGALRSDPQLYRENLRFVSDAIRQHFSPESADVIEFASQVSELIDLPVTVDVPELSTSIELLNLALRDKFRE